jgi:hypothetical protein
MPRLRIPHCRATAAILAIDLATIVGWAAIEDAPAAGAPDGNQDLVVVHGRGARSELVPRRRPEAPLPRPRPRATEGSGLRPLGLRSLRSLTIVPDATLSSPLLGSASNVRIPTDPDDRQQRRDRLLLLAALAHALLTLLGAASEKTGMDAYLKVNTAKKRTHSLFRQGAYWYGAMPNMRDDWLENLMKAFDEIVSEHAIFGEVYALI